MSDQTLKGLQQVTDAINDLTRVTVALQGKFESRAEAVRRLNELSIPPARIAVILAMPLNTVTSTLTKAKQRAQGASAVNEANGRSIAGTAVRATAIGESSHAEVNGGQDAG